MNLSAIKSGIDTAIRLAPWAIAAGALAFGGIKALGEQHWKSTYQAEAAAHKATKKDYTNAQNIARIEAERAIERERARYDLLTTKAIAQHEALASANSNLVTDFLRAEATRRPSSLAGVSGAASVPGGAVQTATEAVLPAADLYTVAAAYAQCEPLIAWADSIGEKK